MNNLEVYDDLVKLNQELKDYDRNDDIYEMLCMKWFWRLKFNHTYVQQEDRYLNVCGKLYPLEMKLGRLHDLVIKQCRIYKKRLNQSGGI